MIEREMLHAFEMKLRHESQLYRQSDYKLRELRGNARNSNPEYRKSIWPEGKVATPGRSCAS